MKIKKEALMLRNILILGSTGSIGVNALEVIAEFPDRFSIFGISAYNNIDILEQQIKKFNPVAAVVIDKSKAEILRKRLNHKCVILDGPEGLIELSRSANYDILLNALVGFAGLAPTIEAIKQNKRIALANKETLVVAGELIKGLLKEYDSELIPVDSEHSAIFQCLVGEDPHQIKKIILTASGGPFRNKDKSELETVTVKEALAHPNWSMGNKISIDSATMMNKGLEIIEAHWLFNKPKEQIEVVVHPQSIIHSMIEFIDGSIKAQLSMPDMKLPIQYAFTYPERLKSEFVETNFFKVKELTFSEPDFEKFRCLNLAYEVMEQAGTAPCILNAANEIAVESFLKNKIKFTQIPELINEALNKIENHKSPGLETIFDCDHQTRMLLKEKYN